MINVAEVRELCADLADNGPGRSGAYELELRCKAARILPAMLDEVERLRSALAERDGRIEALEDALNRAAIVLESRSDKMFRDDCARDARRVLKSKVAP